MQLKGFAPFCSGLIRQRSNGQSNRIHLQIAVVVFPLLSTSFGNLFSSIPSYRDEDETMLQ